MTHLSALEGSIKNLPEWYAGLKIMRLCNHGVFPELSGSNYGSGWGSLLKSLQLCESGCHMSSLLGEAIELSDCVRGQGRGNVQGQLRILVQEMGVVGLGA